MPKFVFTFYPLLIMYADMAWAKVRWISTTRFEEILQGTYVGGGGAHGSEGRARQGRGYAPLERGRARLEERRTRLGRKRRARLEGRCA